MPIGNKIRKLINNFKEKEIKEEIIYADNNKYMVKVIYYKSLIESIINKLRRKI